MVQYSTVLHTHTHICSDLGLVVGIPIRVEIDPSCVVVPMDEKIDISTKLIPILKSVRYSVYVNMIHI